MPTAQFSMIAWPAMPPALAAQVRQWHAGLAEREATLLSRRETEGALEAFKRLVPDITYRMSADGTYLTDRKSEV